MKSKVLHSKFWHLPIGRITGQYVLKPEYDIDRVLNYLQSLKRDWRMSIDVVEIAQDEYEYGVRGFPYGGIFPDSFAWGRVYYDSALNRLIIAYDIYTSGLKLVLTTLPFIALSFIGFATANLCFVSAGLIFGIFYGLNMASSYFFLRRSIPRYFELKT